MPDVTLLNFEAGTRNMSCSCPSVRSSSLTVNWCRSRRRDEDDDGKALISSRLNVNQSGMLDLLCLNHFESKLF
jgi:hypothetical protein